MNFDLWRGKADCQFWEVALTDLNYLLCVCVWGGLRGGVTNKYDYIMKVEERVTNMNALGERGRRGGEEWD